MAVTESTKQSGKEPVKKSRDGHKRYVKFHYLIYVIYNV